VLADDVGSEKGSARTGDGGAADDAGEEYDEDDLQEAQANIAGGQASEAELKREKENFE
jgi:hypothetical protein